MSEFPQYTEEQEKKEASGKGTKGAAKLGEEPVGKLLFRISVPTIAAQLVNALYNIVDRMYIGRIPDHATLSLTGLGLSMPIISAVIAFANLFGVGGAPLCSIARGKGDIKGAEKVVGNAFTMLLCTGCLLYTSPSPRDGLLSRMPSSA